MNFWKRLIRIDRRWIFLLVWIAVTIPLLKPIGLPVNVTPPAKNLYNFVDKQKPADKAVLLIFDFDPSTMPELLPMGVAIMRHCFAKKIPIILYGGLYAPGAGMVEMALREVKSDFPDIKYGRDYVFLGYVPGISLVILSIGESIKGTFRNDYYGNSLDTLPLISKVDNYDGIGVAIDLSGSSLPQLWASYAYQRYGCRIGVGTTAVSAAQYYPWLQTGQFVGMLGGLKGAAEYEKLINMNKIPTGRMAATIGMDAQSIVHLLIVVFIILGNIGYFVIRKAERKG
ncbi:hypothetical protein J7L85_04940 [candidate division WOR-3 bacterium]|nr:hypothetical protein [candidate division WOR-3 bacterium]